MVRARTAGAPEPLAYSITQTAQLLNKSRDTVYRLIRDGELEATRILERPSVTSDSIKRLLERNRIVS